jgi:hypothetical protein
LFPLLLVLAAQSAATTAEASLGSLPSVVSAMPRSPPSPFGAASSPELPLSAAPSPQPHPLPDLSDARAATGSSLSAHSDSVCDEGRPAALMRGQQRDCHPEELLALQRQSQQPGTVVESAAVVVPGG